MLQYRFIQAIRKYQLYEWIRFDIVLQEQLCSKRTNDHVSYLLVNFRFPKIGVQNFRQ